MTSENTFTVQEHDAMLLDMLTNGVSIHCRTFKCDCCDDITLRYVIHLPDCNQTFVGYWKLSELDNLSELTSLYIDMCVPLPIILALTVHIIKTFREIQ